MASQSWIGNCSFEHALGEIKNKLPSSSFTCVLVNETVRKLDDVVIAFLTFEKYYIRNSSRTSMSVVIIEKDNQVIVDATASGGSESWLFQFDWGASDNFIGVLDRILSDIGIKASHLH